MLPACISLVCSSFSDRVNELELGPDVLAVDGLELVNELELGPDVLVLWCLHTDYGAFTWVH